MRPSKIDHELLATEVKRAQAGELGAFHGLVVRFQDMAVGYAFSLLGDYHLAEDAAQEAFLDAFRKLPTLRHPEAFVSWLRTVVFKHCDRLRRCRPVAEPLKVEDERFTADDMDPGEAAEQAETARLVGQAIGSLPPGQREVVSLYYIGQRSGWRRSCAQLNVNCLCVCFADGVSREDSRLRAPWREGILPSLAPLGAFP